MFLRMPPWSYTDAGASDAAGGFCDFHLVTLSAMIFIDVIAVWLSEA